MKNGAKYIRPDSRDPSKMVETNKHYCLTLRCSGLVDKKKMHSPYCSLCRMRRWKESHPLQYAFHSLRGHANERGKDFSLTFSEFKIFAEKTNYMEFKGKTSMSLQIDRIENAFGYHAWNIRALQMSSNARKSFVPYFNGGVLPDLERSEYLELERKYNEPLKNICDEIGIKLGYGSKAFWSEFNKRKLAIYKSEAESIC